MIDIAYAMGQSGAAEGAADLTAFIPLILMFVIFYFLLIRPQMRKTREHREMVANLKRGDSVITSGGIHGRITTVDDDVVTLEITDKVRIKVTRTHVGALNQPSSHATPAEKRQG